MTTTRALLRTSAMLLSLGLSGPILAQGSYPTKAVKIVTASPGTGMDIATRHIASRLADKLGQPVVVEPRAGGGSAVGATVVAAAAPDGYTILTFSNQIILNPWVVKSLPYDPLKDFTPVGRVGYLLETIAVNSNSPLRSMNDVLGEAKAKPNTLRYGTPGVGSPHHLSMEFLSKVKGVQFQHIPYSQTPLVVTDLMGGRVELGVTGVSSVMANAAAGKLRILAVIGKDRFKLLPDVPSTGELGIAGLESPWFGMMGPGGMAPEITARLNKELNAVLAMPEVQEALLKLGNTISPSTTSEFAAQIRSDLERWGKVIKEAGIQPS